MVINRVASVSLPASAPLSCFRWLGTGGAMVVAPPNAVSARWCVSAGHVTPPNPGSGYTHGFSTYPTPLNPKANDWIGTGYDFGLLRLNAPTTNFVPFAAYPPASPEVVVAVAAGWYGTGDLDSASSITASASSYGTARVATNLAPASYAMGTNHFTLNLSNTDGDFAALTYDSGGSVLVYRNGRYEHCGIITGGTSGVTASIGASTVVQRTDMLASKFQLFRRRVTGDWSDDGIVSLSDFNTMATHTGIQSWMLNNMLSFWGDGGGSPMTAAEEAAMRAATEDAIDEVGRTVEQAALS